jgi:hypothetical protein
VHEEKNARLRLWGKMVSQMEALMAATEKETRGERDRFGWQETVPLAATEVRHWSTSVIKGGGREGGHTPQVHERRDGAL